MTTKSELDRLLALVRELPPMTKAQREAQRRSWVIGNTKPITFTTRCACD